MIMVLVNLFKFTIEIGGNGTGSQYQAVRFIITITCVFLSAVLVATLIYQAANRLEVIPRLKLPEPEK